MIKLKIKGSVVDFNPLSTNPARLPPISYLTRLKFKVTTLKVLTRLNNRVATCIGLQPYYSTGFKFLTRLQPGMNQNSQKMCIFDIWQILEYF